MTDEQIEINEIKARLIRLETTVNKSNFSDGLEGYAGRREKLNELIDKLDGIARDANSYEYGLPLYDEDKKEIMREAIVDWVKTL